MPANGASYLLNATVTSAYSCADALSGVNSCAGPAPSGANIDTSTPGLRTFTVGAADLAGNSTVGAQSYLVTYQFTGFLSPLATAGPPDNPSDSGTANFGNAVPLKWQLRDGAGAFIRNNLATLYTLYAIRNTDCADGAEGPSFLLYNPTVGATGGSVFRYDAGNNQYIFNWDTNFVEEKGCYNVVATLNDTMVYATKIQLR